MSVEITRCPRCESAAVVHLPQPIGFNQWHCNQCSHQWDFANPEARALVPNHLSGGRAEQFLEEFLAIKAVVKGEAEQIWNGCSNAHQVIDVAANEDKLRVFTEQFDRWRDQLIALQAVLIVDHLMPLLTKYQISSNEQIWLFPACPRSLEPRKRRIRGLAKCHDTRSTVWASGSDTRVGIGTYAALRETLPDWISARRRKLQIFFTALRARWGAN